MGVPWFATTKLGQEHERQLLRAVSGDPLAGIATLFPRSPWCAQSGATPSTRRLSGGGGGKESLLVDHAARGMRRRV
eukprot:scaffold28754_cov30-Tisochrysis_lutea.AAC.1